MQRTNHQPCHHRIKRILISYQQSAEHSLRGPELEATESSLNASKSVSSDAARLHKTVSYEDGVVRRAEAPIKTELRYDGSSPLLLGQCDGSSSRNQRAPDPGLVRPLLMAPEGSTSYELVETVLKKQYISCFEVGGERRLCMPQVLNKILYGFARGQIQRVSDSLQIHYAECNAAQLEALKRRNVLPMGIARCGLITQTDAERLCSALFELKPVLSQSRLDSTSIPIAHECFGGCKGFLLPREYTSPTSSCIECLECSASMSPSEFVSHTHSSFEERLCHWGFDTSNWRFYIMVCASDISPEIHKWQKMLDEMKGRFRDSEILQIKPCEKPPLPSKHCNKKVKVDLDEIEVAVTPSSTSQSKWKPVNVYTTWAACMNVVQHLTRVQHTTSPSSIPPNLLTGVPVLENPDRVIPFDDCDRYDRNFVPNVSLAVEPFDELHKLRHDDEVEKDFATDETTILSMTSMPLSHRSTHISSNVCHSEDEDDDTESVSSDKLDSDEDTATDEEVPLTKRLSVDLDSQMAFVRSAVYRNHEKDQLSNQNLIKHLSMFQDRQVQTAKSMDGTHYALDKILRDARSSIEAQCRESSATRLKYEEELHTLRQEGAAKMREAVLERNSLLQQMETYSGSNSSYDQAMMAARYKDEAEYWKSRLEDAEAVNGRLQQELVELRKALLITQQQQTAWMSPEGANRSSVITALLANTKSSVEAVL